MAACCAWWHHFVYRYSASGFQKNMQICWGGWVRWKGRALGLVLSSLELAVSWRTNGERWMASFKFLLGGKNILQAALHSSALHDTLHSQVPTWVEPRAGILYCSVYQVGLLWSHNRITTFTAQLDACLLRSKSHCVARWNTKMISFFKKQTY